MFISCITTRDKMFIFLHFITAHHCTCQVILHAMFVFASDAALESLTFSLVYFSVIHHRFASTQKHLGAVPPTKYSRQVVSPRGGRIEVLSGVKYGKEFLIPSQLGGLGEECPLPSRLSGLGQRRELPSGIQGEAWLQTELTYFEGHTTLFFAPICRCFKFVKQYFMSYLGAGGGWGQLPLCPNVEAPLLIECFYTVVTLVTAEVQSLVWTLCVSDIIHLFGNSACNNTTTEL